MTAMLLSQCADAEPEVLPVGASDIEIVSIEKNPVAKTPNYLTQVKVFDQCQASSPGRAVADRLVRAVRSRLKCK